ncbi:MAG TPA: hypothetical protein DGT23_35275 [Micromonosporaceae bacterium]|nr:hypothetical protein [Micromonosporaceae bacterium]
MGIFILTNVRLFAGGCDFTARSNKVELAAEVEEKDSTTFNSAGWKEVLGGLGSAALAAEGFWEAGDASMVDNDTWSSLGSVGGYTVCPNGAAAGDLAWTLNALRAQYKFGGAVGDIAPFSTAVSSSWPLGRGKVLHPPGTARTATGSGTAVEVAAVPSGQYLYATLHVLSVSGTATPTITVRVQSDDASGFPSATTQITFTAATAIGGQIQRLAGPITDTWFRADWTISGTSPSFLFVVGLGIK